MSGRLINIFCYNNPEKKQQKKGDLHKELVILLFGNIIMIAISGHFLCPLLTTENWFYIDKLHTSDICIWHGFKVKQKQQKTTSLKSKKFTKI